VSETGWTVRDATLDVLKQLGLTTVFSNPSHSEMKLFENWLEGDFKFVLGLEEKAVVGMADGYAQATGEPALVIINGGPGLANAMGSVYTAASAKTPMVILGGQQARKMLLGEPFLIAKDSTQLPKPYIKWAAEPARPQDVPATIAQAYQIAKQTPQGPVFVAVPEDDWVRPADPEPLRIAKVESAVVPDPAALEQIAAALNGAERPGLIAGGPVDAGREAERAGVGRAGVGARCLPGEPPAVRGRAAAHPGADQRAAVRAARCRRRPRRAGVHAVHGVGPVLHRAGRPGQVAAADADRGRGLPACDG
jgi:benzoylformate decarboxylase